jgi:hypothetical protein
LPIFTYFRRPDPLSIYFGSILDSPPKGLTLKTPPVTVLGAVQVHALHGGHFEGGWTKAMPGAAVQFDQTGLNTLSIPIMVQWRKKELVTLWPKDFAKASAVWHSQ